MDKALEQIANDYHYFTERYDRLVCTGEMRHGNVMPQNAEENQKIQVNARLEIMSAETKGKEFGFTTHDVIKAISEYAEFFDYDRESRLRNKYQPKDYQNEI